MDILLRDRIKGAMYGVAVGDALGGPVEFMDSESIQLRHGTLDSMIGGGWLNLKPGETTDDTAMTVAVARGIIKKPNDPVVSVGKEFIEWYESNPKDIGVCCSSVIRLVRQISNATKINWFKASESMSTNGKNAGNGALMRTIYPALYYKDEEIAIDKAIEIGEMTHYNLESDGCITLYVRMVHRILEGKYPEIPTVYRSVCKPTGYVVDSMHYAMTAISETYNFEDALVWVVNQGGDADTIGAITGGIAGAMYGYSAIPKKWLTFVEVPDDFDDLIDKAIEQWEG